MKKCLAFLTTFFCLQFSFSQLETDHIDHASVSSELNFSNDVAGIGELPTLKLNAEQRVSFLSKEIQGYGLLKDGNYSPYKTSVLKDGLAIAGAVGVTLLGYELIKNKNNLTPAELATKTRDKLPFFDRFCAGNYSDKANKDSYILFDAAYALPFLAAVIDKNERKKFGQVAVMYIETIAITGSMYTLAAGVVYRSRPFVYGDKAPLDKRLDKGGQRSFYGGHVAATAASTFFIAKVFSDFNPGSKVTPYLYVASGGLTALMSYMRIQAGYHFFSDCTLSSIIGAATGILIPQFHKNKNLSDVSLTPEIFSNGASGFGLTYRF
ncbi:MAG: phosphatase PAP2 family protein [Ginsengibacter sp.]